MPSVSFSGQCCRCLRCLLWRRLPHLPEAHHAHSTRRCDSPDSVAICRSLRPADAGAVGARGGARHGGAHGGRGRAQQPRVDSGEERDDGGVRSRRHHAMRSWSRKRADSSPARRISRWRWRRLNWRGWMAARRRRAWRDFWRWRRFTSAAHRSRSQHYMSLSAPPQPGEDRKPWRGAFVLTEPIPYVGVDTGMLSGKVRVAEWQRRRRALAAGGEARPLHHQHRICEFRDGRGGFRRSADQGQLRGDSGRDGRRHVRSRHADQEAGAPALVDGRSDLQSEGSGKPHRGRIHGEGRRDRSEFQSRRGD